MFGTNRHSLVERCVSLSGISDHDIMLVDSCVLPGCMKAYLGKRANKQAVEEVLTKFTEKFTKDSSTFTPESALE